MAKGWLGGAFDWVYGEGPEQVEPSGAFQDVEGLGQGYADYLRDILGGKLGESDRFGRMASVLRDKVGAVTRTQRGRAGKFAQNRGFLDSGAVIDMFGDIDRRETEQYTQAIEELLFNMEEQGLKSVFQYLSGASNEALGLGQINTGITLAERQQNLDKGTQIGQIISGSFSPVGSQAPDAQ